MRREAIHRLFRLGLLIKGLDGILELAGGVFLFLVDNSTLEDAVTWLTAPELAEDPHDLLANLISSSLHRISVNTRLFAAAYLLGHGVVKLFLIAGLWREKLWVFPVALWIMSVFVLYQLYRFSQRPSPSLLVFTIIDVLVIAIVAREYQFKRNAR